MTRRTAADDQPGSGPLLLEDLRDCCRSERSGCVDCVQAVTTQQLTLDLDGRLPWAPAAQATEQGDEGPGAACGSLPLQFIQGATGQPMRLSARCSAQHRPRPINLARGPRVNRCAGDLGEGQP